VPADSTGWAVYDDPADFPPFLCTICLSSNTWTEPVPVLAHHRTIGYVPGIRGCVDCFDRRLSGDGH